MDFFRLGVVSDTGCASLDEVLVLSVILIVFQKLISHWNFVASGIADRVIEPCPDEV